MCEINLTKRFHDRSISNPEISKGRLFKCPTKHGQYPMVDDCGKYFDCEYLVPTVKTCGEMLYNSDTGKCDSPSNVTCPPYNTNKKVICYFENEPQQSRQQKPEDMDPYLCTHIHYAHANLDSNTLKIVPSVKKRDIFMRYYERVTKLKKLNPKLKVLLSLGGWRDSSDMGKYSRLVEDPENWERFANHAVSFLRQHDFDGLEIDWEFPVCRTENCKFNSVNSQDKQDFASFLDFVQSLFSSEPEPLLLTIKASGSPEIINFAYEQAVIIESVDYIVVMAYMTNAENQTLATHPSRLYPSRDVNHKYEDALSMMEFWKRVAPENKLVLGIRADGRSYQLKNEEKAHIYAEIETDPAPVDLQYHEICKLLNKHQDWKVNREPDIGPYMHKHYVWIGYTDPAFAMKLASFADKKGYGGLALIDGISDDFAGDCCRVKNPLLKSIVFGLTRRGMPPTLLGCP
ncbi:probable chitinase 10 isoform X2 [Uloborus diversus]|uniref:probable chitinase 10 isoform X2 n=1 Tax=Uloborus diversus TaxID=327109 RepID=UPI0024092C03|nr:probable chitinase 10 isoform X2 [Uloborus diversus]